MSIGIGAFANLVLQDDTTIIYEYGNYNLNEPEYQNKNHLCDGSITILKSCFSKPEIHKKIKKMPSGRKKLVIKRIPVDVDYQKMIMDGLILIENCSNCWCTTDDGRYIDVMVLRILFSLFHQYQEYGNFPEHISCNI